MLKIKDNVDLKELEKFGFKYDEESNEYYIFFDVESIGIGKNRYIYIEYDGSGLVGYIVEEEALDTLYDLIKADMVEKVEV